METRNRGKFYLSGALISVLVLSVLYIVNGCTRNISVTPTKPGGSGGVTTNTFTPTYTNTSANTNTPIYTPTITNRPTITNTPTISPTPGASTPTSTVTFTKTATTTPTVTVTPTPVGPNPSLIDDFEDGDTMILPGNHQSGKDSA